ncbi:MAG: hypothetical protein OES20_17960 [Gammaproteobacteria bacterium]|nr:hypothetical protein [Gammaproteobacteria bacterium]
MKMRPRIYYTETDKALMWDRWQKGESLNSMRACLIGVIHRYNASWRRLVGYVRDNAVDRV